MFLSLARPPGPRLGGDVHIPDGYLSPATCAAAYAVAVPVWTVASRRVSEVVKTRNVPLLAVFSALSFLVMMFNIPIPDGTTAHAVGAVIIAICSGPWAAVIAVSRRAAVPGAALRRRRRAGVRRQRLQHGVRDAVRRLRRLPARSPAARR